jgi:5-methylcytosine-specific restriction endonuclease McrA
MGRKYSLEEILPLLEDRETVTLDGVAVKTNTQRLRCFKHKGTQCFTCALEASFFVLEQPLGAARPHLNLYALSPSGQEILMTHDHIVALADGGSNRLDNAQTLCQPCNQAKGSEAERRHREAQKAAAAQKRKEKKG